MDNKDNSLKQLCIHITGIKDERLSDLYQSSVALLNGGLIPCLSGDALTIGEQMKRSLVQEQKSLDAVKLANLLSKIQKSTILRKKSSILQLLHSLHQQRREVLSSGSPASMCLSDSVLGLTNGYADYTMSSSSSVSGASSESYRGGAGLKLHNEKRDGRVARLAAIYKGERHSSEIKHNKPPVPQSLPVPSKTIARKDPQTDVTEDVLIREILFCFQGIEGNFIKIDATTDIFKLDPKVRLSIGDRDIVSKLTEVGWMYSHLKSFCESYSRVTDDSTGSKNPIEHMHLNLLASGGLVNQSLIFALKEELNEFCRLIAVLESQLQDGVESSGDNSGGLTLRRLLLWTLEPRTRLTTLSCLANAAKKVKGGALLSSLYEHVQHGDPSQVSVVRHALCQASKPIFVMLTDWLLDGTLQDGHHEFFIASDPSVPNDRLWHDRYDIRWCMLPSFITKKQASKVLATGKSLNFLRNVCNFKGLVSGHEAIKSAVQKTNVESFFIQDESTQLDDLISLTFRTTSSHVLNEILTNHKLREHLQALRRYLLLGQGDFIHYLMELLEPELNKPANKLHFHNLNSLLESAIAASNAQYEEPDILQRLAVRLLQCSPGECGWDVFSLDYNVDGPIGTVLTAECMQQYLMLFNALWRAKHMESLLSATWKQQAATSKLCRGLPELKPCLHKLQMLLNEMVHLVQQMAYYMTFEVLECSWDSLMTELKSAQSLDDVIFAHSSFLKRIIAGALLDEESRDVRTHLRTLYDLMLRLEALQGRFYNAVISETNAKRAYEQLVMDRTKAGNFGVTQKEEDAENERKKEFSTVFVPSLRTDLKILTQSYQDMVQSFLLMLAQHEDENLHLLSSRIDFNEYYQKRDHRLNMRLTYLHKRLSMGASFCQ